MKKLGQNLKDKEGHPWSRRRGEPLRSYEIFCTYAGIGTGKPLRDYKRLSRMYGLTQASVTRSAKQWEWKLRASAWESNLTVHKNAELTEESRLLAESNLRRQMDTIYELMDLGNKLINVFNLYAEWPQRDLVTEAVSPDGTMIVRKPLQGAADLPKIARAIELIRQYELGLREALEQGRKTNAAKWPRKVAAAAIRAVALAQLEIDAETGDPDAEAFMDRRAEHEYTQGQYNYVNEMQRGQPAANGHAGGHAGGHANGSGPEGGLADPSGSGGGPDDFEPEGGPLP